MGKVARAIWLLVLLGTVCGWPADSWAQQGRWRAKPPPETPPPSAAVKEASSRYQKAIKLYQQEGAVEAALAEMQRAYDLAPHYKVLYNIGQAARTLRDYPLALHAFERYLADGSDKIKTKRRVAVVEDIKELRTYVSEVQISVNVDGATISVNDMEVGQSPLAEPVMVSAGRVRVRAQRGKQQDGRTIVVPGGDRLTVELELAEGGTSQGTGGDDASGADPARDQEPEEASGRANPLLWIGVAAAGAFAVGASITGGVALSSSSDLEDVSYAGTDVPDDVDGQQDTVRALAITTDVLIGAAVASLAVTGVLWLTGVGEQPQEPSSTAGPDWSLQPSVALPTTGDQGQQGDHFSLSLTGRFRW